MTQFTVKWNASKAAKKLQTARAALLPEEDLWFLGYCNNVKPLADAIAVTPLRVVALMRGKVAFEAHHSDIESLTTHEKRGTVTVVRRNGESMVFKLVPKEDLGEIARYGQQGRSTPPPPDLLQTAADAEADRIALTERAIAAKELNWPDTAVHGKLSRKASEAILRQCHGAEKPWLILTSAGGAGTLTAFDNRLAIIKTGGFTSYMAGSLGGERSATFHFADITGIEFNSGWVNGVLEILTASYSGSTNKDFWRGSNRFRNADSNNPWTLSNCLPLLKSEHNSYLPEINELKARVGKSKQVRVQVAAPQVAPNSDGLAEQLQKLGDLHASGVLSAEEFAAAKARLLG